MFDVTENQALEVEIDDENGGQGEVVDSQEKEVGLEGGEEEDPLGELGGHAGGTGPRPREPARSEATAFSAENARLLEQETAARLRRQYDDQVAGLGIPNPFTGKPFQSFEEFKAYGERYRREQLQEKAQSTGRTVEELEEEEENRSWLSRKRAEERAQREGAPSGAQRSGSAGERRSKGAERMSGGSRTEWSGLCDDEVALEDRKKFLAADLAAFVKAFPDVDPAKLEQNPKFKRFAGKRLYQEPLGELYQDFVDLVSDAERAAVEKAAGKAHRSTGGGQGGGMDLLTPAQREELEEWNRDNPSLRMTAKEFLSR